MRNEVWERFAFHFKENRPFYMGMLGAFLGGVLLAVVCVTALPDLQCKELALYLGDFFGFLNQETADAGRVFTQAISGGLFDYVVLTLCALMVIGTLFAAVFSAVKGFINGFLIAFLCRTYGFRTLLFVLCGLVPHALLLAPCYLFYTLYAMRSSAAIASFGAGGFRTRILSLLTAGLTFWGLTLCAALLQGYIEPILLKLISGMFVV